MVHAVLGVAYTHCTEGVSVVASCWMSWFILVFEFGKIMVVCIFSLSPQYYVYIFTHLNHTYPFRGLTNLLLSGLPILY